MSTSNQAGYWGPPTASVDWCEDNYMWTHYIAEFFNSFSSFAMILAGEAACHSINRLEASMVQRLKSTPSLKKPSLFRFKLAFRTITVVGIGSFLFHATLLHKMQMLDELPMLYSVLALFFCLIESRYGQQSPWFPILLSAHGLLVTGLVAFTEGNTQFFTFHLSFGSLEFATLYLVYKVYRARKQEYSDVKRAFEVGAKCYAFAVAVWLTDLNFCETSLTEWLPAQVRSIFSSDWIIKDLYFHAWWHTFVSIGLYLFSTVIMLDGIIVQGWNPKIKMAFRWLPVVTIEDIRKKQN